MYPKFLRTPFTRVWDPLKATSESLLVFSSISEPYKSVLALLRKWDMAAIFHQQHPEFINCQPYNGHQNNDCPYHLVMHRKKITFIHHCLKSIAKNPLMAYLAFLTILYCRWNLVEAMCFFKNHRSTNVVIPSTQKISVKQPFWMVTPINHVDSFLTFLAQILFRGYAHNNDFFFFPPPI